MHGERANGERLIASGWREREREQRDIERALGREQSAKQSRAAQSAEQSRAEQREHQSRAEQSRAEQSRAEQRERESERRGADGEWLGEAGTGGITHLRRRGSGTGSKR